MTAGSIYHRTLLRLLFPVRIQKKKVAHDFRYDPRSCFLVAAYLLVILFYAVSLQISFPLRKILLFFFRKVI